MSGPVVFTAADAHRRCKATRNSEVLAQAWVEFATRAWEAHHDRVAAIRAANAQITGRVSRERRPRMRYTNDMGRVYFTRSLGWIVVLLSAVLGQAGDPPPGPAFCEAVAPYRAMVAAEVLWPHHNPPNDPRAPFWGWYIPPVEVPAGFRVHVRAEGHPAWANVAFTEIGIGGRYQEHHCGVHPSVVFADGFEDGTTAAWDFPHAPSKGAER